MSNQRNLIKAVVERCAHTFEVAKTSIIVLFWKKKVSFNFFFKISLNFEANF
jgi:hypothetical protein